MAELLRNTTNNDTSTLQNQILVGDNRALTKTLPSEFVQCIVTSPPYFGHRKYTPSAEGDTAELGREPDPAAYVQNLIGLFCELKRVLHPTGTLWLNLGDAYREQNLLGLPWRVAFGLQDSGWMLRSEIIWNKPNAMPSSVKNRPTTAHEHIFLFTKSADYYYDADAIREPHVTFTEASKMKGGRNHLGKRGGTPEQGKNGGSHNLHDGRWDQAFHPLGRNKRTVWDIPLGKFRGSHFAVFPEKLVEICILAGTKTNDFVLDPFMGSGTTGLVAHRFGRRFLGIELVPEYAAMARERIQATQPMMF
jgi:DNA modification methylase